MSRNCHEMTCFKVGAVLQGDSCGSNAVILVFLRQVRVFRYSFHKCFQLNIAEWSHAIPYRIIICNSLFGPLPETFDLVV